MKYSQKKAVADRIRLALKSALVKQESISFKEFLESAPLEDIDFERSSDPGRVSEFEVSRSTPM
jgi:hypothetical protein